MTNGSISGPDYDTPCMERGPGARVCDRPLRHEGRHASTGFRWPESEPSIPESWDLVVAGDGQTWHSVAQEDGNYRRLWYPLGEDENGYIDEEVLELGTVRRAATVALPDDEELEYSSIQGGKVWVDGVAGDNWLTPAEVRSYAGHLMAEALLAERGESR